MFVPNETAKQKQHLMIQTNLSTIDHKPIEPSVDPCSCEPMTNL